MLPDELPPPWIGFMLPDKLPIPLASQGQRQ
jgi:hypothetical protein